jgi:hypothetical protein
MKLLPSLLVVSGFTLLTPAWSQEAESASTDLAGFHTVSIKGKSSKVVGANFVRPSAARGNLEAAAANTLTDNDADFTSTLTAGVSYWVEITSGPNKGIASIVSAFAQNTLTTDDDLSALCGPTDTYDVRPTHTIASLFGATNSAGLRAGSSINNADTIKLPDGLGGVITLFYSSSAPVGWRNTATGTANAADTPVYHVDAMEVNRSSNGTLNLRFAGTLRTGPTHYGILTGLNQVDINYPVGSTLANSGLQNYVKQGDSATADLIWVPNTTTGYKKYYYTPDAAPLTAGWKLVGSGNTDQNAAALTSGIIIERRDPATNMTIVPDPAIYGGL